MPELFSRMDNAKWITPAAADILEPGPPAPDDEALMRQRVLLMQRELAQYGTPGSIVNIRSTPSHTLYIVKSDSDVQTIKGSLARIARAHPEWLIGFIPELRGNGGAVGIVVRTQEHHPLSLRRALDRSSFRDYPSRLAFTIGITLSQRLIVRDLINCPHLLIIGDDDGKGHLLRGLMLTLMLLNTPAELRFVIAADADSASLSLASSPHAFTNLLESADSGIQTLEGLVNEMRLRQQEFTQYACDDIMSYNALLRKHNAPELPRLVVLLDVLEQADWQDAKFVWEPLLTDLLQNGAQAGIHLILTANSSKTGLGDAITGEISTRIVMRSAENGLHRALDNFHPSLLHFTDAFLIEADDREKLTPLEISAASPAEVRRASDYWREQERQASDSPAVPSKRIDQPPATKAQAIAPDDSSQQTSASVMPRRLKRSTHSQTDHQADVPTRSPATAPDESEMIISGLPYQDEDNASHLVQARALAAYLGWLGVGPLHDVLGIVDEQDALALIAELKREGVLEDINHPTPRFIAPI